MHSNIDWKTKAKRDDDWLSIMIGEYGEIMIDSHLDYVISLLNLMLIDSIVVNIDCCQINVRLYYLNSFIYVNIYKSTLQIVKLNTGYVFYVKAGWCRLWGIYSDSVIRKKLQYVCFCVSHGFFTDHLLHILPSARDPATSILRLTLLVRNKYTATTQQEVS